MQPKQDSSNDTFADSFISCILNGKQQIVCDVPDKDCTQKLVAVELVQEMNLHTPLYDPSTLQQTLFQFNCFIMLMKKSRKNISSSTNADRMVDASENPSTPLPTSTDIQYGSSKTDVELLTVYQQVLDVPIRASLWLDTVQYNVGILYRGGHPIITNYFLDHYPQEVILEMSLVQHSADDDDKTRCVIPSVQPHPVCMSTLLPDMDVPTDVDKIDNAQYVSRDDPEDTQGQPQHTTRQTHDHVERHTAPDASYGCPAPCPMQSIDPEKKLVQDIYDILLNDCFGGSTPSTHLQSSVMNSPGYQDALLRYDGAWHQFLRSYSDQFYVFHYNVEEIRRNNFVHTCHANENRVALCQRRNQTLLADRKREQRRRDLEQQVFSHLHALLAQYGECDSHFILLELEQNCSAFEEITHPSYHVLERIIRMNEGKSFCVRDEPRRGLFVSLK